MITITFVQIYSRAYGWILEKISYFVFLDQMELEKLQQSIV